MLDLTARASQLFFAAPRTTVPKVPFPRKRWVSWMGMGFSQTPAACKEGTGVDVLLVPRP